MLQREGEQREIDITEASSEEIREGKEDTLLKYDDRKVITKDLQREIDLLREKEVQKAFEENKIRVVTYEDLDDAGKNIINTGGSVDLTDIKNQLGVYDPDITTIKQLQEELAKRDAVVVKEKTSMNITYDVCEIPKREFNNVFNVMSTNPKLFAKPAYAKLTTGETVYGITRSDHARMELTNQFDGGEYDYETIEESGVNFISSNGSVQEIRILGAKGSTFNVVLRAVNRSGVEALSYQYNFDSEQGEWVNGVEVITGSIPTNSPLAQMLVYMPTVDTMTKYEFYIMPTGSTKLASHLPTQLTPWNIYQRPELNLSNKQFKFDLSCTNGYGKEHLNIRSQTATFNDGNSIVHNPLVNFMDNTNDNGIKNLTITVEANNPLQLVQSRPSGAQLELIDILPEYHETLKYCVEGINMTASVDGNTGTITGTIQLGVAALTSQFEEYGEACVRFDFCEIFTEQTIEEQDVASAIQNNNNTKSDTTVGGGYE